MKNREPLNARNHSAMFFTRSITRSPTFQQNIRHYYSNYMMLPIDCIDIMVRSDNPYTRYTSTGSCFENTQLGNLSSLFISMIKDG